MAEDNTPTNVVDDITMKPIFVGTEAPPTGNSFVYADVEEIFDFVQFNRRNSPTQTGTTFSSDQIDAIKKTILEKGYIYDTGEFYNSAVVFPVSVDISGEIQIGEGNHRLLAAYEVAKETGQKIYVPIHVYTGGVVKGGQNQTRVVNRKNLYNALKELFKDVGASEYTINNKIGETFDSVKQYGGANYLGSGGSGGNSTSQENIKKFFTSIGVDTFTYKELPENNVFKTGINTLPDTPTNVVDDLVDYYLVDNGYGELVPVIKNPDNFPLPANTIFGRPLSQDEFMRILIERDRDVYLKIFEDAANVTGIKLPDYKPSTIKKVFGLNENNFNKYASSYYDDYLIKTYWVNKQKDIVDIVQKIKSGQINNIDTKKLTQFIYELQAFETSGRFQDVDEKADIVKKVIFGNEPILETNVDFGSDFGKYVEAVGVDKEVVTILQNNSENIKTILKDTINMELKNIYPNEYIVVFRSPNPNSLDDIDNLLSSYSKDLSVSQEMSRFQTKDGNVPYFATEEGRAGVRTYLVPTNEIIDTEALGIRGGINSNEKEILINPNKAIELDVSVIEDMKSNKEININKLLTDTPGGSLGAAKLNDPLVFDSWIDEYAKTTTSFVDNLPLSNTVKNQFNNLVQGRARNLATPGGLADAVDVWELGVLGLMISAVAYKEYDEIPTILTNKAVDMFNNMTSFYGIPPIPKEEYDLDYERINKIVETGEKFMPTDIMIKKVGEIAKGVGEQGLATGFGYVPTTPKNTDTMETTEKIQPGVQEEKMFKEAKPKKIKSTGGSGAKIL